MQWLSSPLGMRQTYGDRPGGQLAGPGGLVGISNRTTSDSEASYVLRPGGGGSGPASASGSFSQVRQGGPTQLPKLIVRSFSVASLRNPSEPRVRQASLRNRARAFLVELSVQLVVAAPILLSFQMVF